MMFRYRALPYLQKLSDGVIASRTVKTFGIGGVRRRGPAPGPDECPPQPHPWPPMPSPRGPSCGSPPTPPTREEALRLIAPVEEQVKAILGDKVIGVDVDSLEEVCFALLKDRGLTVGTAESCTGGCWPSSSPTCPAPPPCSGGRGELHQRGEGRPAGGAPGPAGPVRRRLPPGGGGYGPGAKAALGCDIALSTTGVAGPDADDRGNPIGLVYLGLAWGDQCQVTEFRAGPVERERVRRQAAQTALDLFAPAPDGTGLSKERNPTGAS